MTKSKNTQTAQKKEECIHRQANMVTIYTSVGAVLVLVLLSILLVVS